MFNNFPEATHGDDNIHGAPAFGLQPNETRYSDDRAAILHRKAPTCYHAPPPTSLGSKVRNVDVTVGSPPECGGGVLKIRNSTSWPHVYFTCRYLCFLFYCKVFTVYNTERLYRCACVEIFNAVSTRDLGCQNAHEVFHTFSFQGVRQRGCSCNFISF